MCVFTWRVACRTMQSSGSGSRALARLAAAGVKHYSGPEPSLADTQLLLAQFKGGSVQLDKNDDSGIATICLHRPDKKNAIGGQMLVELRRAAEELAKWEAGKGFILHGAGGTFSSGGDLVMSRATTTPELGMAISRFAQHVSSSLRALPLVSVALVQGVALGGAAELCVASCDWRVLTPEARIGFVHGHMGLTPGWGGGVALSRLVGASRALELMTSSRLVDAEEASRLGLATAVLGSAEQALEQTRQWLQRRVHAPREVLRATKLLAAESQDQEEALERESRLHAPLWGGQAKLQALDRKIKHK